MRAREKIVGILMSSPPVTQVPLMPVPLTPEQQLEHITEGIIPTLQNIVATMNLNCQCRLDLKTIALHARNLNAKYNPKRFAAVIMRILDLKTS